MIRPRYISPLAYLLIPLIPATFLCVGYLATMGAHFNLVAILTSQQGNVVKLANESGGSGDDGRWGITLFMLTATIWWAQYRFQQVFMPHRDIRWIFLFFWWSACAIDLMTCLATVDRVNLIAFIVGSAVIWMYGGGE